jgi:predicted RND superfamily exporter protein
MLSDFALNRALGVLSALTVSFALAVILLLLPALLSHFGQKRAIKQQQREAFVTVTPQ